ncbi:hypothetical protein KY285_013276 [Solanum tuberosum]|nr:hypothetical protein KY285_013276 [Solanum tuberosum]
MPESHRWLIMKGRLGEAKEIMYKVSNDPKEAEFRLKEIKKAIGIDENCDDDMVKIPNSVKSQGEAITTGGAFFMFAGISVIALIFLLSPVFRLVNQK